VKSLVLSGALAIVLSGARSSCYRVQRRELSHCSIIEFGNRNSSNKEILRISSNAAPIRASCA
jgi:hypothetical protein